MDYINQIILGDCLEIRNDIDLSIVKVILADPPYGWNLIPDYTKYKGGKKYEKIDGDDRLFDFSLWDNVEVKEQFWFGAENYLNLPPAGCWFCWDKYPTDKNDKRISGAFELIWSKNKHTRKIIRIKAINTSWATVKESVGHPTQKPIELMKWFIEKFSKPGDIIFDPYIGTGTTALACIETNRKFIGIEKNKKWYDVARQRINTV